MSADALLTRLDRVRRTGEGRWMACCPAHEDRRASLSARKLDDGRVLLHDFAGCSTEEVLRAIGLDFEALFPERQIEHGRPERRPWRMRDVIAALEFELTLALIVLADAAEGRQVDRERANKARERVLHFMEELGHAA